MLNSSFQIYENEQTKKLNHNLTNWKKKIIVGQKSQNTVKKRRLHVIYIYEFHIFIQIQTRWLQFKTDSSYAVSKRKPEIYEIMNVFRVY